MGFLREVSGAVGDWREFPHDEVIAEIEARAGKPAIRRLREEAQAAERIFRDAHDDALSMLRAQLGRVDDEHLKSVLDKAVKLAPMSYDECLRAQLPSGQTISRDRIAIGQGLRSAPHQEVIAQVAAIRAPFQVAAELAALCRSGARHLERVGGDVAPTRTQLHAQGRVVIGHGRSPLWRELKDLVADRLHLPWDEFNRVAVAGVATTDRLQEMVEGSVMAFIVATAEDSMEH